MLLTGRPEERQMRLTRPMLAVAGATAALALVGCGADTKAATIPTAATGSLESLAAKVKCTPDIQTDADELRQAICKMSYGKFVLATFATDRGQREWLNGAKDYGGSYLVGAKWVAVGDQKMVTSLRGRLGGTLEEGASHASHAGHSG
jgi:hypothetical protein